MHILQPSNNIQLSRKTPDRFLKAAARVIRKGYGFPSVFNADAVVEELLRQGKTVEDAREGGTSGCVETGAFGKEAYILTGYFNLVKILELALNDGVDPRTGKQLGPRTGDARDLHELRSTLLAAWQRAAAPLRRAQGAGQRGLRAHVRRLRRRRRSCRCSSTTASPRAWTTTPAAPATTPATSRAWASAP